MKKIRNTKISLLLVLILCIFCGCSHDQTQDEPICTVVTRIELTRQDGLARCYLESEKMGQILDYLRLADPYGIPEEDPEKTEGYRYQITVSFSDGHQKTYLQQGELYLMSEGGYWQKIKKGRGQQLEELLLSLPGD